MNFSDNVCIISSIRLNLKVFVAMISLERDIEGVAVVLGWLIGSKAIVKILKIIGGENELLMI